VNVLNNSDINFTTGTSIGGPDINGNNSGFNGSMSDVAVFNYPLTPAQITQLYADSGGYNLPPEITAQPVSHNAYTNGTASFSVAAIGAAPLKYQWWHGLSPVANQTNTVLNINSVQSSDAGNYSVVVSNNFGAVTSSIVTLIVVTPPTGYESIILADGPIGYWPLDLVSDGGVAATDISSNGNNGAYQNVSLAANQVAGPSAFIPNSISFNGSGQFVDLGAGTNTSLLNVSGQVTLEAWVQPAGAQLHANANILAKGWDGSTLQELEMSEVNSSYFGSGREGGNFTVSGAGTANTNWNYLVSAYDGVNWNLYLNGALVATHADGTGPSQFSDSWRIGNGSSGGNGRYFTGNICQVALYTNALTAAQVSAHYAMGLHGTTNVAPTISIQPVNQRVVTNTAATFTVAAAGNPPPAYQWYSIIGGVTNLISGATSAAYTTPPVQDSDSGNGYYVVINNSIGNTNSAAAILTAGHMVTAAGFLENDEYYGNYSSDIAAFSTLYPTASSLPVPDKVEYLSAFNDNQNLPQNGGERIHGWFTPPATGNYIFFEASDDSSALWLSTDSSPANVFEIAQNQLWMWTPSGPDWTCSNTGSAEYANYSTGEWRSDSFGTNNGPNAYAYLVGTWSAWPGLNSDGSISLVGGRQYYIELDHYQGIGGQNAAVTYKLVGDSDPNPGTATLLTGNSVSTLVPDTLAPQPRPLIAKVSLAGLKVTASGSNGLVNAAYNVLASTNLTAPLSSWTISATGRFDSTGNFNFTNTVPAGSQQQFYRLVVP
jgi:hypothetical protein